MSGFRKYMHIERYGNEELWDFIKLHKNPTINFRTLNILAIKKVKEIMPEIF